MPSDPSAKPKRLVIPPSLYRSPAYQALRASARLLIAEMATLARKLKGDGWLTLGEREAARILGVDRKAARNAFHQLESLGFIVCLQRGRYARKRLASKWRITFFPFEGQPPTREYEGPAIVRRLWLADMKKARVKHAATLKGVAFITPQIEIAIRARAA
jgi:hypothetical protein